MNVQKYELIMEPVKNYSYSGEFSSSDKIADFAKYDMNLHKYDREKLVIIGMNNKNEPIAVCDSSIGNINTSIVSVRDIAKFLLLANCNRCVMVHNHPSGSLSPSYEDEQATRRLKTGLDMLEIQLLDSIVVSERGYTSIRLHSDIWEC